MSMPTETVFVVGGLCGMILVLMIQMIYETGKKADEKEDED